MRHNLEGVVDAITFHNEDNGYTVLQLQVEGEIQTFTCVGAMPTVTEGESLRVEGSWEDHRKFGRQFVVECYEMLRYLYSNVAA